MLEGHNVFYAKDTFALVCNIVTILRDQLEQSHITGITGAAGKTSTKAMLMHALRSDRDITVATEPENRNRHRPILHGLSIAWKSDHTVLEVSSAALEVFRTTAFPISPDVAIVTAIAAAHLEHIGSVENVARLKSGIFLSPPPGGTAVINGDTEYADLLIERVRTEGYQVVIYGESSGADIRLVSWDPATHQTTALGDGEEISYRLGLAGRHSAPNSLAVLAALRAHGVQDWREAMQSLADFQSQSGRGDVRELALTNGGVITLLNESYNANPASIGSSLQNLGTVDAPQGARRVALLGDILELGEQSDRIHRELADVVDEFMPDRLVLFGTHMRALRDELQSRGHDVRHWDGLESVKRELPSLLCDADVVLMKASGGTGLNEWVKSLLKAGTVPTHSVS
ncbi:Mur ligase family protein [Citricoccus muralis]|uniref:Mur ligase family protein n=1 Tax=Citricoccus muralis TaxID=169134 RepID=A0ABY8H7U3_9MICC|nr:Mur ligase family protein [Citricoccus muralis]WFP16723.1 Mur ligase family protein [Citricoccus muralis]